MTKLILPHLLLSLTAFAQPPGFPFGGPPPMGGDSPWVRNAVMAEGPTFDPCNAHQPPNGEYHYHDNPVCLRLQLDDNIERSAQGFREKSAHLHHSPILGWANDGFPIYGPYGKDEKGIVRRMRSSFRLRSITERKTLAAWSAELHRVDTVLSPDKYGPAITKAYPLGWYVEDFEFVKGLGDLDVHNGRFAKTPDYPNGTYAYYVTIDEKGEPAFPYVMGRQYYGQPLDRRQRGGASDAEEYFSSAKSDDPLLRSWMTKYNQETAKVLSAREPEAGARSTWLGQSSPARADVQKLSFNADNVIVQTTGLPSHIMGPWYDPSEPDGVFPNWPREMKVQQRIPRQPKVPEQKVTNGLGSLGRWVNGVALFNMLDGATYSTKAGRDQHGRPPGPPPGDRPPPPWER